MQKQGIGLKMQSSETQIGGTHHVPGTVRGPYIKTISFHPPPKWYGFFTVIAILQLRTRRPREGSWAVGQCIARVDGTHFTKCSPLPLLPHGLISAGARARHDTPRTWTSHLEYREMSWKDRSTVQRAHSRQMTPSGGNSNCISRQE